MNKIPLLPRRIFILVAMMLPVLGLARPWPHVGSDLPVDERLVMGHLSNGIRYVILPWAEPPQRVSVQLMFEAGFLHESDRQIGLAHLIEHMAFNGTKNFSAGEMVEYFQRLGMAFGADTNAHTWWRETVYKLELPNGSEELLRDGLLLFRDYADGMLLDEAEIESEKGIVLSELRERDTPGSREWKASLEFSLPDSLIHQWRSRGEMEVVRMAARQDLVDYYEKWYVPEKMVLVAVGEVEPDQLVALFEEYFGNMPNAEHELPELEMGAIRPVETKTGFYSQADLPQADVGIFLRRAIEAETQTLERVVHEAKLGIANYILSRRFSILAKEENAVITSGTAYDYRWLDFVRYTGIGLNAHPRDWQAALELGTVELNRALEFGFLESEFAEAKDRTLRSLREAAERASTRRSRDLSASLIRSIRDGFVFMDPARRMAMLAPVVEQFTIEEVWDAFKDAWSPTERMVWVSGDFSGLSTDAFQSGLQTEVTPPKKDERTPFQYTAFGDPGKVVADHWVEDLEIRQVEFANGVRLNLKRTDFEANKISVKLSLGNGILSAPEALPGLSMLADFAFVSGGLEQHSFDEIRAFLASRSASVSFSAETEFFSLSGTTNQADLLFQLQLLTAYMAEPGYRPEGLRLFARQLDAFYNQLSTDANNVLSNEGSRLLASGDFRFGYPSRAALESRTFEELAQWLNPVLGSGYLEMSVVGDFADFDEVIAAVAATVGALPDRDTAYDRMEDARHVRFPESPALTVLPFTAAMDFGIVTVHWPTIDNSEAEPVRRLSILGRILGDRLRKVVREETGESYSPYAFNSSTPWADYGFIRAFSGVQPRSADLVLDLIKEIAVDLSENGIDADELLRAVEPVKTSIRETVRNNAYWTNSVLLRSQTEPQRLDWARSYQDFWDTITVAEINDLAATFLDPQRAITIKVMPASTIQ